jgi:hypothetical protein
MKIEVDIKRLYGRDKLENVGIDGRIVLKIRLENVDSVRLAQKWVM